MHQNAIQVGSAWEVTEDPEKDYGFYGSYDSLSLLHKSHTLDSVASSNPDEPAF